MTTDTGYVAFEAISQKQQLQHDPDDRDKERRWQARNVRVLTVLLLIMIVNTTFQLTIGVLSGSLAVISDGSFNAIDCLSFGVNLAAERYASHRRWIVVAASFFSLLSLIITAMVFGAISLMRVAHPSSDDLDPALMLAGGCFNLLCDAIMLWTLYTSPSLQMTEEEGQDHHYIDRKQNMQSALAHLMADVLRAAAVVVVGIVGLSNGNNIDLVDAWVAFLINALVALFSIHTLSFKVVPTAITMVREMNSHEQNELRLSQELAY